MPSDPSTLLVVAVSSAHLDARLDGVASLVSQPLDAVTGQFNTRLRETADSLRSRLAETTGSFDRRLAENTASLNERLAEKMRLAQQSNRRVGERRDCFDTTGKHLKNAQNAWDRSDGMRKKFEAKLEATAQLEAAVLTEGAAGAPEPSAGEGSDEMPLFAEVAAPARPERVG